jgi:hypothetical protein
MGLSISAGDPYRCIYTGDQHKPGIFAWLIPKCAHTSYNRQKTQKFLSTALSFSRIIKIFEAIGRFATSIVYRSSQFFADFSFFMVGFETWFDTCIQNIKFHIHITGNLIVLLKMQWRSFGVK